MAILVGLFEGMVEFVFEDTVFATDGDVISIEVLDGHLVVLAITEIVAGVFSLVEFVVDEISVELAIFPKYEKKTNLGHYFSFKYIQYRLIITKKGNDSVPCKTRYVTEPPSDKMMIIRIAIKTLFLVQVTMQVLFLG